MRQVLINLLTNASRFTEAGEIRVTANRRDDEVVVCVADTGHGIAGEQLSTIFDEFRQLDADASGHQSARRLGVRVAGLSDYDAPVAEGQAVVYRFGDVAGFDMDTLRRRFCPNG